MLIFDKKERSVLVGWQLMFGSEIWVEPLPVRIDLPKSIELYFKRILVINKVW